MLETPGLFAKLSKASKDIHERLPKGKAQLGSLSWGKLDENDGAVWTAKLDGAFMYYTLDKDGVRAYSWRRSKKNGQPIEHTEKLLGLNGTKVPRQYQGAVLRGEAWDPERSSSEIAGVLNSRKDPLAGSLRPALHGITELPGVNVNTLSNKEQFALLKRIAKELGIFDLPAYATDPDKKRAMKNAIKRGDHAQTSEGLVVIPASGKPYKSVVRPTNDYPVVGFTEGLGQFAGNGFGSLLVGPSDNPSRVGTGYTEDMRRVIHKNPDLLKGLVAKVEVSKVFPSGKLRGASFKGFHPEKSDPDALMKLDDAMKAHGFSKSAKSRAESVSREEAIRRINAMSNMADNIDIEIRRGKKRNPTDLVPMPFTYGEVPGLMNDADGDPWDVALMPYARLNDNLKVVGYVPSGKGNDKLLLANRGVASERAKKLLKRDFDELTRRMVESGRNDEFVKRVKKRGKWFDDPVYLGKTSAWKDRSSSQQKDKEKAILIALQRGMALSRRGLDMYGMKTDGSQELIAKGKSYDSLWSDALDALEKNAEDEGSGYLSPRALAIYKSLRHGIEPPFMERLRRGYVHYQEKMVDGEPVMGSKPQSYWEHLLGNLDAARKLALLPDEELSESFKEFHGLNKKGSGVTEEFAPGIPAARDIKPLPERLSQGLWEIAIQEHLADKAGKHYDLRLGDPDTGHAHSWALPKATLPDEKQRVRLAIQQPTHTMQYMDFEGEIPEGTYGSGTVTLPTRGQTPVNINPGRIQFNVPGKGTFVLRQKDDKQWMLLKKGERTVLDKSPGEFSKHAESVIRPLLAAMVGVPLAGAAYGLSQHPQDPLKAMSGGAIGAATTAVPGAITGASLVALLQYLGKTGLKPANIGAGAALGGLAGAALGAREGAQAPVGLAGSERDRLLAEILKEMRIQDQGEPWQPDLLR